MRTRVIAFAGACVAAASSIAQAQTFRQGAPEQHLPPQITQLTGFGERARRERSRRPGSARRLSAERESNCRERESRVLEAIAPATGAGLPVFLASFTVLVVSRLLSVGARPWSSARQVRRSAASSQASW